MCDKDLVYEQRIVAFIDILGFSTMIKDSRADTLLRHKLKRATEIIRESIYSEETGREVCIFSDSAVISYPMSRSSAIKDILIDIIHLQLKLGSLGITFRGGIAIGDCYHDGNNIFGPAMNEAYNYESKKAEYPRVVISEGTLQRGKKLLSEPNSFGYKFDIDLEKITSRYLKPDDYLNANLEVGTPKDADALYFVDFLSQPQELTKVGDEYLGWLRDFRGCIVEGLNRYCPSNREAQEEISRKERRKVFQKYKWLLTYWNSVVEKPDASFPAPEMDEEDQAKFRELYKKLKIRKLYPYV